MKIIFTEKGKINICNIVAIISVIISWVCLAILINKFGWQEWLLGVISSLGAMIYIGAMQVKNVLKREGE